MAYNPDYSKYFNSQDIIEADMDSQQANDLLAFLGCGNEPSETYNNIRMGNILEELGSSMNPNDIPENPIEGLDINDVLYGPAKQDGKSNEEKVSYTSQEIANILKEMDPQQLNVFMGVLNAASENQTIPADNILEELGSSMNYINENPIDGPPIQNAQADEEEERPSQELIRILEELSESMDINGFDENPIDELGPNIQFGAGLSGGGTEPSFSVVRQDERFYKKFHVNGTEYTLKIADPDPTMTPENWLRKLLDNIIDFYKRSSSYNIKSGDMIGMTLSNSDCGTGPIFISLRRADQMAADVVFDHIMRIFDSNKEFFLNGHLKIHFHHILMPHGSGRIKRAFGESNTEFIEKKAAFFKYAKPSTEDPEDKYCLPYALVILRAFRQSKSGELPPLVYKNYLRTFSTLKKEALKLCDQAGVNIPQLRGGCSFDEIRKFQRILPDYQIIIYGRDSNKPQYTDARYNGKTQLNIYLHNEHYYAMRSVPACFGLANYVCIDCNAHTRNAQEHVCKYSCSQCFSKPKCEIKPGKLQCTNCYRTFYGHECYMNHLKSQNGRRPLCETRQNCPKCYSFKGRPHICGKRLCSTCEKFVPKDKHLCHMPKYETKRLEGKKTLYVLFDLETQQDTPLSNFDDDKFEHVPNLCILNTVCTRCIDNDEEEDISVPCSGCGVREQIYHSYMCIDNFMNYLVDKSNEKETRIVDDKKRKVSKFDKFIVISHNGSGFDSQFILKYIYGSDCFSNPSIIMNGTRVIDIDLGRVKFIDSLNYFQCALAKLPELFGFEGSKGHYPHYFNTRANEKYIGPLPAKQFYGHDAMSVKGRAAFDKWYDSLNKDYVFDNEKELIEYCRQDVRILRKSCVKFVTSFWRENNIDPFLDASTIAGACNKVFRSKYMEEDTIGTIPPMGYRMAENQSKIALKWLIYCELESNIEIQHVGRGRELNIPGVGRVDGFYGPTNTVFEFHGCYWHMCPTCFPAHSSDDSDLSEVYRNRRDNTLAKENKIKEKGYNLVVKRECEFKRFLEEQPAVDELVSSHPLLTTSPLEPREAFYGGRTNATKLYYKSDGTTKMHYFDICSLYPFVNKTAKYPIGHPRVHVGDKCNNLPWQNMDGLIKVTVRPPRNLFFPVLPTKLHKRLMFILCKTCAKKLNQCKCEHNEKEREITGTWVLDEVKKAMSLGYEIVKVHEIWEYKVTQYDPTTKKGGFFSGFINHFLKVKAEASGWPKSCKNDADKKAYIEEFFNREGIWLEADKIIENPSLRLMAKIMLNSFWGRFGMRDDLLKTELIRTSEELVNKILDPSLDIHSIIPLNDDHMLIQYKEKEEARNSNKTTNVVIAAFTTAYARLELYKYLEFLGPDRIWYFDTDSILFISRHGDLMPEVGNFLGQMTDELEKDYGVGSYIIELVSGGPKNYAYKVFSPTTGKIHVVVKVKGITLNYKNSLLLNFDLMKEMVILSVNDQEDSLVLYDNSIRRTITADVYSARVKKTYRFNYNKRQLDETDFCTYPYGY